MHHLYTIVCPCFCCYSLLGCRCGIRDCLSFFFFNDTATTEIYTLSLHDALPIFLYCPGSHCGSVLAFYTANFSLRQRPAIYTAHFSLRQRPTFYTARFSLRQHPRFFLPNSRCGSAPSFYPAHFSLRQHPSFLYCLFLVAAAPRFLYCSFLVAAAPRFLYSRILIKSSLLYFAKVRTLSGRGLYQD